MKTYITPTTYTLSTDPELIARMKQSQHKLDDFNYEVKELVEEMDVPYSYDDEDLLMHIARIVEATGGTMPFTICSHCGNQDDWHNSNNGECA